MHHFALLIGYGASAVNPYLAFETIHDQVRQGMIPGTAAEAEKKYIKAVNKGIVKVISKMGISTIQSYHGAQVFEAVGLNQDFIDEYFTWTSTRIGGVGIDVVAREVAPAPRPRLPAARPSRTAASPPAASTSSARTASTTSSTRRPSTGSSRPAAPATTRPSRSTPRWSTTSRGTSARCAA